MSSKEECDKYLDPNSSMDDSFVGHVFGLLLFVGAPFLFILSMLSNDAGSNIIWRLILAVFSALAIVMPNITATAYTPLALDEPNIALQRCEKEWEGRRVGFEKDKSKIEKLETVYSVAVKNTFNGFKQALFAWIASGVGLTLIEYGLLSRNIYPSWITSLSIILFPIFGFINFVLMIWAYLRYRRYSKQLFAIQLKKNDKAEISIKI